MRLPNNLKKSLSRNKPFDKKEIPCQYVLGKGHVKFFYDKMGFLKRRFEELVSEMKNRGYKPNFQDSSIFDQDKIWMGDYKPTKDALEINRARMKERS